MPKRFDEPVASLMKLGRSMGFNVIAATQHPTAKQIGEQVARSFTHRFVGRVESNNAARWASTGIEGRRQNYYKNLERSYIVLVVMPLDCRC